MGCSKVSAGCKNCYAEVMSRRLKAMGVPGYELGFHSVRLLPARLSEPSSRAKPTLFFVNSMSDLFHDDVPESFVDRVFGEMERNKRHTFQVLTKRAFRLFEYTTERAVPDNVWIGVSVEDRRHGLPRIDLLRRSPAGTRFLSVEPLLEDLGDLDLSGVDWVIVGGESGHRARPMRAQWVRRIQGQCQEQGVRFFFKQWGAFGTDGVRRSKKSNGRILDGAVWNDMPLIRL